jgi:hypothetical protein
MRTPSRRTAVPPVDSRGVRYEQARATRGPSGMWQIVCMLEPPFAAMRVVDRPDESP